MKTLEEMLACDGKKIMDFFPFQSNASLEPLIAFWEETAKGPKSPLRGMARRILKALDKRPELRGPVKDLGVFFQPGKMRVDPLLDSLFSAVFPPARQNSVLGAAFIPFLPAPVYATQLLHDVMQNSEMPSLDKLQGGLDTQAMARYKVLSACFWILRLAHGIDINLTNPMTYRLPDPESGLMRFHKVLIEPRFAKVSIVDESRAVLDPAALEDAMRHPEDLDRWLALLNPDVYQFEGLTFIELVDMTEQELLGIMKARLLNSADNFLKPELVELEEMLRSYTNLPNLDVGLASLDPNDHSTTKMRRSIWKSWYASSWGNRMPPKGSIPYKVVSERRPMLVENLADYPDATPFEEALIKNGIRSYFFSPLFDEENLVGVLELASKVPGEINAFSVLNVSEVEPLLGVALSRRHEAWQDRISDAIRDNFTGIHPVVTWRFREVAIDWLEAKDQDIQTDIAAIRFEQVNPLYGQCDIRGSSTLRNLAVQQDLSRQIELAIAVLDHSQRLRFLPATDELIMRMNAYKNRIEKSLNAADEYEVQTFLREEVEHMLDHLEQRYENLSAEMAAYREAIDEDKGFVYKQRRAYECSLQRVNETVTHLIEQHQEEAQAMFPHYFEMYQSDGVEYNAYIGESLVPDQSFDAVYLRNLRIWQLISLARITRETAKLRDELAVPMETTQLVLAHGGPLDIRFRMEERRFDVDGAYNMRYEIAKKRIDKVRIKSSKERLTQPGMIAVVYEQRAIEREYRRLFEYLTTLGLVEEDLEVHELEPMQGISGMKALRVRVRLEPSASEAYAVSELIEGLGSNS